MQHQVHTDVASGSRDFWYILAETADAKDQGISIQANEPGSSPRVTKITRVR